MCAGALTYSIFITSLTRCKTSAFSPLCFIRHSINFAFVENSSLCLSVLLREISEPMNCVWKVSQSPKETLMSPVKFLKTGHTAVGGAEIWRIPVNSEENTMKEKNM